MTSALCKLIARLRTGETLSFTPMEARKIQVRITKGDIECTELIDVGVIEVSPFDTVNQVAAKLIYRARDTWITRNKEKSCLKTNPPSSSPLTNWLKS